MKRLIIIALAAIMALCVPSVSSAQIKRKAYQQQTERTTLQNNKNNKQTVIQDRSDAFYIIEEPKPPVVKEKKKIEVKYQGDVSIGYVFGLLEFSDFNMSSVYVNTVHGILVSKYFFAGIGTGFHYCINQPVQPARHSATVVPDYLSDTAYTFPIYANLKGIVPVKKDICSIYFSASAGFHIGRNMLGTYVRPGIGVNYKRFFLDVGYLYLSGCTQTVVNHYSSWDDTNDTSGIYFGIGYKF